MLLATPAFAASVTMQPAETAAITVDATVYHLATPDTVNMSVSCDAPQADTKPNLRAQFNSMLQQMAQAAGGDATVRRNGSPTFYQSYGSPMPVENGGTFSPSETDEMYSGNMSVVILNIKNGAATRINNAVEDLGCSVSWDARLVNTTQYARDNHDALFAQLADKKAYYEDLLGVTLSRVSSIYVSTTEDTSGYYAPSTSYDPETNTIPAMTTLSVTYDVGTGVKK